MATNLRVTCEDRCGAGDPVVVGVVVPEEVQGQSRQEARSDMAVERDSQSAPIWRCEGCGALVHPADEDTPAAWCMRCRRMVPAVRDGEQRPA